MDDWGLPGADAFLDHIRAVVLGNRDNAIVALPQTIASENMADALTTKLHTASARDVHHYISDGRTLDVILYEAAGVPATAPVAELMQHMCESRPLVIDAIGPETAAQSLRFLQEYANASRNIEGSNPLVVITSGVPLLALPTAPKLTTIAWDNWLGEADVLAFIVHQWRQQNRKFDRRSRLCARIICNLALWDIVLAQRLMALAEGNWQDLFDSDQILRCLADAEAGEDMPCNWESGGEARFDGEPRRHLYTFAGPDERRAELIRRLWAAQAAHLLPALEEQRLELVQKIKLSGKLRLPLSLNGESVDDLEDIEFGGLMHLIKTHELPQKLFTYADALRRRRNQLAHLKPLSAPEVDRLLGRD